MASGKYKIERPAPTSTIYPASYDATILGKITFWPQIALRNRFAYCHAEILQIFASKEQDFTKTARYIVYPGMQTDIT
ncbi:MAG: hypothetical protein JXM70_12770 [Pirellulales bacterium]|nr:hypothetical protein [Pirellulales bacterium]